MLRRGIVVGRAAGTTNFEGRLEVNQFPDLGPQTCFRTVTPDIRAGDIVRTLEGGRVTASGVVRNIGVNFNAVTTEYPQPFSQDDFPRDGTFTVPGRARSTARAPINLALDTLQLTLVKSRDAAGLGGRNWTGTDDEDLVLPIGSDVRPNGTFLRVQEVGAVEARNWGLWPGELTLTWARPGRASPLTVIADEPLPAAFGCPQVMSDRTPPAVRIDFGPSGQTTKLRPVFRFSADKPIHRQVPVPPGQPARPDVRRALVPNLQARLRPARVPGPRSTSSTSASSTRRRQSAARPAPCARPSRHRLPTGALGAY